jgi:hypothetical protein
MLPIAWGVGNGIFPLWGIFWALGNWEENRRKARFAKWAKESGYDLVLHNSRCRVGHPLFQVIDAGTGMYVRVERSTGKVLSTRKGPGPYAGIPIENFDNKAPFVWVFDPRKDRYVKVYRRTGLAD